MLGPAARPAGHFSFGLLDGLQVRLRRPHLREAPAGFGLERLATAFMNNPGYRNFALTRSQIRRAASPEGVVVVSIRRSGLIGAS